MPHISVDFTSAPPGMTLDILIKKIAEQVSGTRITSEDWYAQRRLEEEAAAKGNARLPASFLEHILGSVDRAASQAGPTKTIEIPMGQKSLSGRISLKGMLIFSDDAIDDDTAFRLRSLFQSIGILKDFRISNKPSYRTSRHE